MPGKRKVPSVITVAQAASSLQTVAGFFKQKANMIAHDARRVGKRQAPATVVGNLLSEAEQAERDAATAQELLQRL